MNLPTRDFHYYAGIDPGFSGAIAWMNATGSTVNVEDMPTTEDTGKTELHLPPLWGQFTRLRLLPDCAVGIEWPNTRPGDGAERCQRFGQQMGTLQAFAFAKGLGYFLIAPNLWKGRLGLDGKTVAGANERAAEEFECLYPGHEALIRGPRGGLLDGRMDALLICHFLRTCNGSDTMRKFGRQSPEAFAFCASGGGRSRGKRPMKSLRGHTNVS